MAQELPWPAEPAAPLSLLRRTAAWVTRVGLIRATFLLSLIASLASFALTWLMLRASGHASMGSALWISILVPLPVAWLFGGTCIFLVMSLHRAWNKVHEQAMQDPLTGLHNRRHFLPAAQRELDLAVRHRQPLALLILDIDHFKGINDAHGHLVGDAVLVDVATRCRQALRTTDLLARWGGEEFILLLPNTPLPQARIFADRIRDAVHGASARQVHGRPIPVTASVGAAGILPGQSSTLEDLIRRADQALYLAKAAGRNQVSVAEPDSAMPAQAPGPAPVAPPVAQ